MKKVIILVAVIVTIVLIYFSILFLSSQNKEKLVQEKQDFLFKKKTECMEICKKLYQDDKESLPESENSVFNPLYNYSEKENACFYSGGWLSFNPSTMTKRVLNCQTNKEVLTFTTIDNKVFTSFCDTCVASSDEYSKKEKVFMEN